jgi:hypothetical protein
MRSLILIHRYLGIGMGLLMVMWCLSGIVMIHHPFPQLDQPDRIGGLAAIDWHGIGALAGKDLPGPDRAVTRFQVEMVGARPVLRLWFADSPLMLIDLNAAQPLGAVTAEQATAVAKMYAAARGLPTQPIRAQTIEYDQWTIGGTTSDRPLYKVSFGDADRTELYVSGRSGALVQKTTARQRFWAWLGAIPHWLYPSVLRSNPVVWSQVVIWTSLTGTFLAALGLFIGIQQLRKAGRGHRSVYTGVMQWHHVSGTLFGLFALTWVASGMLSMNPWGLMQGGDIEATELRLTGSPPAFREVQDLLQLLEAKNIAGVKALDSAALGGRLFVIGTYTDGKRIRYDADGAERELNDGEIAEAAARIAGSGATWKLLTQEDAYHYGIMNQHAVLPVVRVRERNGDLYYLDSVSGSLVNRADAGERAYRWWHSGLHRLDFWPALRSSAARNLIMLPLLAGTGIVCMLGAYLGLRRINPMKSKDL